MIMSAPTEVQARFSWSISDCLVDADTEPPPPPPIASSTSNPVPVSLSAMAVPSTLRVSLDPAEGLASFRLAATVGTSPQPFYLDIPPHHVRNLTLHGRGGPRTHLTFHVTTVNLVVPNRLLTPPEHEPDRVKAETLRSLALEPALRVVLPANLDNKTSTDLTTKLQTLCDAVNRGCLRPDPQRTDLKTLYRGQGGRVVQAGQDLWCPPEPVSAEPPPPKVEVDHENADDSHNDGDVDDNYDDNDDDDAGFHPLPQRREPPPPEIFAKSVLHGHVDDLKPAPPPYAHANADPAPTRPSSTPANKNKRRRRAHSTPSADSWSDSSGVLKYRTHRHIDLVVGEREKIMYELMGRAHKSEQELEAKCARADELVARLTDLVSQAEQQGNRSGGQDVAPTVSSTAAAAAAASSSSVSTSSSTASAPSVVSVASVVSDRTQAYVASKLQELRTELAILYPTTETMQHKINEELDRALVGLAENEEMNVAIDEAVDRAVEKVREKQLQSGNKRRTPTHADKWCVSERVRATAKGPFSRTAVHHALVDHPLTDPYSDRSYTCGCLS